MSNKDETLTIAQFKAWLEGVEEMQPDDWTPSETQWKRIRAKIAKLCEDMEKQPLHGHHVPNVGGSVVTQYPLHNPRASDHIHPSTLVDATVALSPTVPHKPLGVQTSGVTVKTPDIDTSNGTYVSNFE